MKTEATTDRPFWTWQRVTLVVLLLPLAVLCGLCGYPFTAYLLADAAADEEL